MSWCLQHGVRACANLMLIAFLKRDAYKRTNIDTFCEIRCRISCLALRHSEIIEVHFQPLRYEYPLLLVFRQCSKFPPPPNNSSHLAQGCINIPLSVLLLLQAILNPFYTPNTPITSNNFKRKASLIARKYLA